MVFTFCNNIWSQVNGQIVDESRWYKTP